MLPKQDTEFVEALARKAYEASWGGADTGLVPFDQLSPSVQQAHRQVVNAVIEGLAPHIATLMHTFGNKALQAEHKAQTLSSQLYDVREWALELEADKKGVVELLTEAQKFVSQVKWQGDPAAAVLLRRIETKLAEVNEALDVKHEDSRP